jgi:beta-mannanase
MDGSGGSLSWLFADGWEGSGYTLSLAVPIIPTNAQNVAVGTLATGATGAYNRYFVTLAQTLVAAGESNADLRLGWEFDGNWYAWQALTPATEASYATYFQQIVTAMRSVAGQAFKFVWNPDAAAFTTSGYSVAAAYPGNAYVNYIGLDQYDQSWASPQTPANAWSSTVLPALTAARNFATAQGKPIALCEWGVAIRSDGYGLGDDPLYVNNMTAWMTSAANNVAYESYFDYNTLPVGGDVNAEITGGSFPNSLAAFIGELG